MLFNVGPISQFLSLLIVWWLSCSLLSLEFCLVLLWVKGKYEVSRPSVRKSFKIKRRFLDEIWLTLNNESSSDVIGVDRGIVFIIGVLNPPLASNSLHPDKALLEVFDALKAYFSCFRYDLVMRRMSISISEIVMRTTHEITFPAFFVFFHFSQWEVFSFSFLFYN